MIEQSQLEAGRLTLMQAPPRELQQTFAEAVREGLSARHKTLPSRFLYDARGSELFEQITELPEYYLTRCEQSILEANAAEIVSTLGPRIEMVEFGSGSSKKTRLLMEAALSRQPRLGYTTIDISAEFGRETALRLLKSYERLDVTAIAAEYFQSLDLLPAPAHPRMFLFLGSNIGNFEDAEAQRFLAAIRSVMAPADGLLIGIDLDKDRSIIEPAYNDKSGVTAAFNTNMLQRINRELGGEFSIDRFIHSAPYVREHGRVEMRLIASADQEVPIRDAGITACFKQGEYIHTENSRKYTERDFAALAAASGFTFENCWFDQPRWFGLLLLRPVNGS